MNKMKVKVKKIIAVFALIVLINNVMYCADIIEKKDRTQAGKTLPAHGLYLVKVQYK